MCRLELYQCSSKLSYTTTIKTVEIACRMANGEFSIFLVKYKWCGYSRQFQCVPKCMFTGKTKTVVLKFTLINLKSAHFYDMT